MPGKTLIITPTYNEVQNIKTLLDDILSILPSSDILVIDDNSPDGTAEIVRPFVESNKRVNLIDRKSKLGLGTAYMQGFSWAMENNYKRVITMDADLSHQPKYLKEMEHMLDENDLVIGSRYIPGGRIEGWPLLRKLISKLGNLYASAVTGLAIRDMTSGFLGMNRSVISAVLKGNVHSEGYSFLIEIKSIASKAVCKIKEFPIVFLDRVSGKSKISRTIIIEALITCLRLRIGS
jgi:dolichol-phosphate mannosyltransferase